MTSTTGTATGFYAYDAVNFKGFDENNLSTFEKAIRAFRNDTTTQAATNFDSDILKHIANHFSHGLSLDNLRQQILNPLYKLWLEAGNTGTQADMLLRLYNVVDTPSEAEIVAGITTAAVTVRAAKYWYNKHEKITNGHHQLFDTLRTLPQPPITYPDTCIDGEFTSVRGKYNVKHWAKDEGMIVFEVRWNFGVYAKNMYQRLCTLISDGRRYRLRWYYQSQSAMFLQLVDADENVLSEIFLADTGYTGSTRIVFGYGNHRIYMQDRRSSTLLYHKLSLTPDSWEFNYPIDNTSECAISNFTHYSERPTASKLQFLIL